MKLSESIRHFRTIRNMTQEELAKAISISPQAISKWERGESLPDASLLPVLADALDVSLDRLYGREKVTLEDLMTSISSYMQTIPKEEVYTAIRTIFLASDVPKNEKQLLELVRNGAVDYASVLNTSENGFTLSSLRSELPFSTVFCEPLEGWGSVLKPEERYQEVFDILSDHQALNTLFSLFRLPHGFSFDESYAAKQFELENASETLKKLEKLYIVYSNDITIDGIKTRIWFYRENISFIGLFAFLNEMIYHQNSFAWNQYGRISPLLRDIQGATKE